MLTYLNSRKKWICKSLVLIYALNLFQGCTYELLHLVLHVRDIVALEYRLHSHHHSEAHSDLSHTHSLEFKQHDYNHTDEESISPCLTDKNIEYKDVLDDSILGTLFLGDYDSLYLKSRSKYYLDTLLPPPKMLS